MVERNCAIGLRTPSCYIGTTQKAARNGFNFLMQNLSQMAPLHFSTLLARKPSQIRFYIKEISQSFSKKGHTVFFALSSDFQSPEGLQDVVHDLRGLASGSDGKGRLVGCLSGPVSEVALPLKSGGTELSCAIAIFDSAQCVPFYSSLSGRKEIQVGRWHSFRGKEDIQEGIGGLEVDNGTDVNWEDIWNRKHPKTSAELLPKELLCVNLSSLRIFLIKCSEPLRRILLYTCRSLNQIYLQRHSRTIFRHPQHSSA